DVLKGDLVAVRADPREAYRESAGERLNLMPGVVHDTAILVGVPARSGSRRGRSRLGNESALAYTILTPTFLVIMGLVAYPFFMGVYLSLQSKLVGAPGRFVGLDNYVEIFRNDLFLRTMYNSVVYTVVAVA